MDTKDGVNAQEDLLSTAYHEAGHAVIGYRLHLESDILTIVPDYVKGTLGSHTQENWDSTSDGAREQVIAYFAGSEAQRYADPEADLSGSCSDNEHAAYLLQFVNGGTEKTLRAETANMIRENWAQISAVASELVRAKTLFYEEWSIIIDAIDEGESWENILAELRLKWGEQIALSKHRPTLQ